MVPQSRWRSRHSPESPGRIDRTVLFHCSWNPAFNEGTLQGGNLQAYERDGKGTEPVRCPCTLPMRMPRASPPLWVPVFGYLLQLYGFEWDVVWHVHQRRESFWTTPHLMVYLGVAVVLISGFLPLLRTRGRVSPGLALLTSASGLQVVMAPVDDLWHRLYGLDNTLWSFPHLVSLPGGLGRRAGGTIGIGGPRVVGASERETRRDGVVPNRLSARRLSFRAASRPCRCSA